MTDRDAVKLDRLIRRRRRELGIVPSRWQTFWIRLATTIRGMFL
ncbi:MAG: hypothetical protein ACP5I8_16035 [Phycisphaerae bacterium]